MAIELHLSERHHIFRWCFVVATVSVLFAHVAGVSNGQTNQPSDAALGQVDFPISCSKPAQAEFNRAVALLHHMTYPQAREAFEKVARTDPQCAMAHWGIAMTLFQPLWPTRPGPEELRRGCEAVQKAKALKPPTEHERLFVAAAEAFFREPASDYWERIGRWEQAMEKVHAAFPEDPEATTFYALAHLATAPSDKISRAHSDRAAKLLLGVLAQNHNHPGAIHYLVHANDVPGREREDFEVICGYEKLAPRNAHALHMPTHIYTRIGDWDRVIRGNLLAAEAALEYPAGKRGQFVWDEFAHAIEYLIYAYLQKGADDRAEVELKRLLQTERLEPTFKTAFHLASTQARYALERRAWGEAQRLVPREPRTLDWDRFPWPEAVTWFARGLGAAHQGEVDGARRVDKRLLELESAASRSGEDLFARNIHVLRLEVKAWSAHAEHDKESSLTLMHEAADLEESTPKHAVTPGPTLPARELLGDLFLEQKHHAEALAAYKRSLELYPRRFNSLLGAARAARATGDEASARTFYRELLNVADAGGRQAPLKEAREFARSP